ncbi:hypothetical protein PoB_002045600 [Plakobranchus ocellatus]|uniref:Uncharacterized protein n=1 Tax=Plakobranchus ocellatus TaxID=259542 RepID=A0AAV3Z3S3_9GAST|nr:hypothetical protein PoB_002045600 [Plakobranchus ocellatus]
MSGNTLVSMVRKNTCRLRLSSCRSVGAILCVLQPGLTSVALLDKENRSAIMHNSTNRCHENYEASLVIQIIRLNCRKARHSNGDTQSISSAITNGVVSRVGFP